MFCFLNTRKSKNSLEKFKVNLIIWRVPIDIEKGCTFHGNTLKKTFVISILRSSSNMHWNLQATTFLGIILQKIETERRSFGWHISNTKITQKKVFSLIWRKSFWVELNPNFFLLMSTKEQHEKPNQKIIRALKGKSTFLRAAQKFKNSKMPTSWQKLCR